MDYTKFQSPFSLRYSSNEMQELFSMQTRIITWRKLWVELARAEHELGLPITKEQIKDLEDHVTDIDFDVANEREKVVNHDVMAHVYAYGEVAKSAKGIIHLGATSCYVTDNADLIIYRTALTKIKEQLVAVINSLVEVVDKYKSLATIGYTHFQPAQPVTVGKRLSLYLQDFVTDLETLNETFDKIKFLGCRGTTGTEASFMSLFENDTKKIDELNEKLAKSFNFEKIFDVSGQTYPRKTDSIILNALSQIAQSAYRFCNDLRLLQHDHQIEEPFSKNQIGSSAMAYKQNPMLSERVCSLSRYVLTVAQNGNLTASVQWFERTLDDSANRRVVMPESFLCVDGILSVLNKIISGLRVNEKIIEKEYLKFLPFIATENIMMQAVKKGADRQKAHEIIRVCSVEANNKIKQGLDFNLFEDLLKYEELHLTKDDLTEIINQNFVGRSCEQVEKYLNEVKKMLN